MIGAFVGLPGEFLTETMDVFLSSREEKLNAIQ